ncbi:MAG: YdjY domain-containing protein [Planctomyces sp.]
MKFCFHLAVACCVTWMAASSSGAAFGSEQAQIVASVKSLSTAEDQPAADSPLPAPVPEKLNAVSESKDSAAGDEQDSSKKPEPIPLPAELQKLLSGSTPLNPESTVFLNKAENRITLRAEVACRSCVLEMLCVPRGTKEHESIFRFFGKAWIVHTAFVALGVETGTPAAFSPEFSPPEGTVVEIQVIWIDEKGKTQKSDVREWVRHNIHKYQAAPLPIPPPGLKLPYQELRFDKFNNELLWFGPMSEAQRDDLLSKWDHQDYQKAIQSFYEAGQSRPMTADFVFTGSQFYKDPETGEEFYQAEGGWMICLANFADAMIDIREQSSASKGSEVYEAWTEKIPPEDTPVLLELTPQIQKPDQGQKAQ